MASYMLKQTCNGIKQYQRLCRSVLGRRWASAVSVTARAENEYKPGVKLHGYTIKKVVPVPELYLTAIVLSHDATQAQHLHIAREDSNNVFGVAFRTTPMDHSGVPHILEHTALCGSNRYPIRDPFFKMLTRSLNTFMNAFTASDWTMYPFSSQNPQDFKNLMSVYLDAAFFPRLRELDFMQEGWRLENENLQDPSSPVVFKGVVYNEMKGVFSTAQNLFAVKNQNLLLPSHTYSVVSGGDPAHITNLSWQQLRDFHTSQYHPSNARFYTYGSFPLEDHLEYISTNALAQFTKMDVDTSVPKEVRWSQSREESMECMPDPMAPDPNKQTTVTISYLLTDITDAYESFVLSLLSNLLKEGESAPFYQSLIVPNIGSDFSPVDGYGGETRDTSFSVGLQGIHRDSVSKVKDIIHRTFDDVIREGIDPERIEALLHKIELGQKHQTEKFGLSLGLGILPSWMHDGDPTEVLRVNHFVDTFKTHIAQNPRYLQDKIQYYFKDNPHRLTLVMNPVEEFEATRQKEENDRLSHMVAALSDQDKQYIYDKGQELLADQMTESDLSCLPTLLTSDIEARAKLVTLDHSTADGVPLQLCSQPTNGVTYFRAVTDISSLPPDLLPYVPLFCQVLTSMGAGPYDYRELSQQIDLKTGGLTAEMHVSRHHSDQTLLEQGILLTSLCLDRNIDAMFDLWLHVLHRLDMSDKERLGTLVMMEASELANGIAGSGHRYAMTHAASSLSPGGALQEQVEGMTQVGLMKSIAEGFDMDHVLNVLTKIASHVFTSSSLRCSLNATPEFMPTARKSTETFIQNITQGQTKCGYFHSELPGFKESSSQTHFELPFQVNYTAKCVKTVPYTHPDFASLRILAGLMGSKYLHREIREKGGAYGGGAVGSTAGQFSFYSYRDPNCERTLEAFDGATQWAVDGGFTQQDIDESKLLVFSQVDAPVSPGNQGLREFLNDISYTVYQHHREQLIAVSRDDIIATTRKYLVADSQPSSISVLGPENLLTREDKWQIVAQS